MTRKKYWATVIKQHQMILMILPAIAYFVTFCYVPLWGWYMAFVEYKLGRPFYQQTFVGLHYFRELFKDFRFYNALKNTVVMSALGISINGFIMPIFFAVILNEVRLLRFKKTVQTISYLPHFVSWVVVAGIVIQSLSPSTGIINEILVKLRILKDPINFLAFEKYFYAVITISSLWKSLGWNSIIFIAAIAGVDQELYEAAHVDGASRLRRIWHITLPSIRPTIIIIFIISISGLISGGFEPQMLLSNPLTTEKAEVLYLYALKYGVTLLRFSFGTAIGIFQSVIAVSLMLFANGFFKRFTDDSLI